jgi:hypothetical protein
MEAFAEVVRLPKIVDTNFEQAFNDTFGRFSTLHSFEFYQYNRRELETNHVSINLRTNAAKFKTALKLLAAQEDSSTPEFRKALLALDPLLQRWSDQPPARKSNWTDRFRKADYTFNGIDFSIPARNLEGYRKEAMTFLDTCNIFNGQFRNADLEFRTAPWKLIRFYDEKKYNLINTIPWLVGSVLLATGTLVRMRLSDFDLPNSYGSTIALKPPKHWVPVWTEKNNAGVISPTRSCSGNFTLSLVACVLLFLFIEFWMNEPLQRIEWCFSGPVMFVLGITTAPLLFALWEIGGAKLNPKLANYSIKFRRRMLSPFFISAIALFISAIWILAYSGVVLARTTIQTERAIIQGGLALFILVLLLRAFWSLLSQWRHLNKGTPVLETDLESKMNIRDEEVLLQILPGVQAQVLNSCMLALMPVPAFISAVIT